MASWYVKHFIYNDSNFLTVSVPTQMITTAAEAQDNEQMRDLTLLMLMLMTTNCFCIWSSMGLT